VREKRVRIARDNLHLPGAERGAAAMKLRQGNAVLLNHHHPRGAAGRGFETERPAAGEKIQAREAGKFLAEPVEQRFAHAVRGRPQPGARCEAQHPAAVFSADDAQPSGVGAASGFARIHASMLAAASWAARLKAGLARTREVLNTDVGELLARRKIDESLFEQLESALLQADCGVDATRSLLEDLRGRVRAERIEDSAGLKLALKAALIERLSPLEGKLRVRSHKPCVIMVAGVNGAGKTTSIGKLAKWLQNQGSSVMLAAGDTFRAAAREQLAAWGERNGVTVIGQQGGDPGAVVFDAIGAARARGVDVLIADTAGRLATQLHLMEEIRKVKRVIAKAIPGAPHETLLVLDAGTGQNAIAQAKAFDDALGLTGLILTKLDGSAKGGVILGIAITRPIPLFFIGVGEGIDDLQPFVASEFVEALVD
jgi:fused signal recognition particle receptor